MFITYIHPSQLRDREKQQQVSSFAAQGQKSKPHQKKAEKKHKVRSPKGRPFQPLVWRATGYPHRRRHSRIKHKQPQPDIVSDEDSSDLLAPLFNSVGGIREDSFQLYPIEASYLVKWAADHCENRFFLRYTRF